jgi:hypothetical protein
MKALEKIDGTPEKRIYTSIIADYDIEKALCELIDNAIDNGKNNSLPKVSVDIRLDIPSQTIEISDNSGGVSELKNLISPGATGNISKPELIGIFGVGTKRAAVALAKNICIKTRIRGEHTKILKYDEDWINSDDWNITPFVADCESEEISLSKTIIELTNLRKHFDHSLITKIYDHLSKTYAFFIKDNFLELKFNDTIVTPTFFENWSYSPRYPPTRYWGFINVEGKQVKVEILAGLSNKSNPSENWGVYIYCNKRLIAKDLKNFEVGFGKGLAGNPHPSISLLNILVFLSGDSHLMPWNSSKSDINYSHRIFKIIQKNLQDLVIRYAKISRALEGEWAENLFKYTNGNIEEKGIVFERALNRELPPLPPPKKNEIIKVRESNKKIFDSKPWTKGIFGGIEAEEVILRKDFSEKNRILLIILDSTLEIAFKEFLVYDSGNHYSDPQLLRLFSRREDVHLEIKKYPKGNSISKREWTKVKYYYDLRCKLIHQRASINLIDRDIEIFSETVKSILKKLFNFEFNIGNFNQ